MFWTSSGKDSWTNVARFRPRGVLRPSLSPNHICCRDHRRVRRASWCALRPLTMTIVLSVEKSHRPNPRKSSARFLNPSPDRMASKLLPSTHVSVYWRRTALSDPSLCITIYLSRTPPPLLDMILARANNQLFTIHADHRDFDRHAKL